MMNIALSASPGEHLNFHGHHAHQVEYAFRSFINIQALHQHRVLRGDSHRTTAGVAMVAVVRGSSDGVIVNLMNSSIAVQGNQRSRAYVYRVRTQGDSFRRVHSIANPARDD